MDKVDAFLAQNIIKQSVLYKNIATKVKQGDYDILFYFSNIEKLEVFLLMQNLIKDASQKVFLFRQAWTMAECNYMYIDEIKKFFLEYKDMIMTEKEKDYLENLPNKFTIYRGANIPSEIDKGISWSIDKKTANKFIKMPKTLFLEVANGRTLPFVYNLRKKQIKKENVICYINERNEDEIIYGER